MKKNKKLTAIGIFFLLAQCGFLNASAQGTWTDCYNGCIQQGESSAVCMDGCNYIRVNNAAQQTVPNLVTCTSATIFQSCSLPGGKTGQCNSAGVCADTSNGAGNNLPNSPQQNLVTCTSATIFQSCSLPGGKTGQCNSAGVCADTSNGAGNNLPNSPLVPSAYPNTPSNTPTASTCSGETIGGICFPTDTGLPDTPIANILSNLFSWIMGLFSALCVMAFVISGIQYLTSAGDMELIKKAKNNAQWSIVGVLVGLSGFVIVKAIESALKASPLI